MKLLSTIKDREKGRSRYKFVFIILITAVILFIILNNHNRPDLLGKIVGCYKPTDGSKIPDIFVDANGVLSAGGSSTHVSAYEDKAGISMLPTKKVIIEYEPSEYIDFSSGNPFLLRFSDSRLNSFIVPSEKGADVEFNRYRCQNTGAKVTGATIP
ncbi:MAG: hypothetical protein ABIO86_08860 [Sphingomonas sp.]